MLQKHEIIAIGIEPPNAVISPRIDEGKETNETGQRKSDLMTINDLKKLKSSSGQMDPHEEVEINGENQKAEIGSTRFD